MKYIPLSLLLFLLPGQERNKKSLNARQRGKKDKKDIKKELTRGRKCDKITELFARETSGAAEMHLEN